MEGNGGLGITLTNTAFMFTKQKLWETLWETNRNTLEEGCFNSYISVHKRESQPVINKKREDEENRSFHVKEVFSKFGHVLSHKKISIHFKKTKSEN